MSGKLSFLVGFGAGYVVGARSGRQRYEQIVDKASQLWNDPSVQRAKGQAQHVAAEKAGQAKDAAAAVVKDKVGDAVQAVKAHDDASKPASGASKTGSTDSATGGSAS